MNNWWCFRKLKLRFLILQIRINNFLGHNLISKPILCLEVKMMFKNWEETLKGNREIKTIMNFWQNKLANSRFSLSFKLLKWWCRHKILQRLYHHILILLSFNRPYQLFNLNQPRILVLQHPMKILVLQVVFFKQLEAWISLVYTNSKKMKKSNACRKNTKIFLTFKLNLNSEKILPWCKFAEKTLAIRFFRKS